MAYKNVPSGSLAIQSPFRDLPFWGICIGHALTHWYPAMLYILLPYIAVTLELSVTQAGLLITVMHITKSVFSLPIGAITDMVTRKNVLLSLSLILAGIPFFFISLADWYGVLLVLLMLIGIGNEMWHPASFTLLSERYPEKRGLVFGYHGMAANFGDMVAPAIIGALALYFAWNEVIMMNIVPGILVSLFVLFLVRSGISEKREEDADHSLKETFAKYKSGLKELLKNKTVLLLALISGFRSMAQNGIMTFLPIYLALQIGLSPLWVGIYVSILQGGGLLAAPIVGAFSDKIGRRRIVSAGLTVTSVLILAITFIRIDLLLVGTIALTGFFLYSLRPVMQAWAMESTDQEMAGTTTSLMFTSQSLLASVAPLIGGLLADHVSFTATFWFIGIVILVGNVIVLFIPKDEK